MTIGVAASGPNAGAAVRAAVLGAELLGRGAIGGFAVFAVLDEQGFVHHATTQRGGISALDIPSAWLHACHAAVISSGPDRPEPLLQFLPGADGVGLVTGHRLPNRPALAGADAPGTPLNHAVLARLAAGEHPQLAVDALLAANPEIDAGLIALDVHGRLGYGNSTRVERRGDLGQFHRESGDFRLAFLHNSIAAHGDLTADVADLAWASLVDVPGNCHIVHLKAAVAVRAADRDRVHIDADGTIVALDSTDPFVPTAERRVTVIYLGAEVWQDGQRVGTVASELYANVATGTAHPAEAIIHNLLVIRKESHVTP